MRRSEAGPSTRRARKSSSTSTPVILWSREPLARNLPSALAEHGRTPALTAAGVWWICWVLDGRDERLKFLGVGWYSDCHLLPQLCGIFGKGPAFNSFTLDGGVEVFPSELFDGAERNGLLCQSRGLQGPHGKSLCAGRSACAPVLRCGLPGCEHGEWLCQLGTGRGNIRPCPTAGNL